MKSMKETVEEVNQERKRIRAAVLEAVGPVSVYEMARHYGTSRATMGKIVSDEIVGAPSGRKPKIRSSSDAIAMIKGDYKQRTKSEYIQAISKALDLLL